MLGKKNKKDFNAHDSFFDLVTTAHILAAAVEVLGMDDLDDTPCELLVPKDVHTLPKCDRRAILDISHVIVHSYVDLRHSVEVRVQDSVTNSSKTEDGCNECEKDTRQHEEEDKEDDDEDDDGEDAAHSTNSNIGDSSQEDNVQAYAKEVMTLGLLYADGIGEGDGVRVPRVLEVFNVDFQGCSMKELLL